MKNVILFDTLPIRINLLPFTFTRPLADIRLGILTIRQKWERMLPGRYSYFVEDYLAEKYELDLSPFNYFIAGHIMPTAELVKSIVRLKKGEALFNENELIAFYGTYEDFFEKEYFNTIPYNDVIFKIEALPDLFVKNEEALIADFLLITTGRASQPISATNTVIGAPTDNEGRQRIFIEEGAYVEGVILNISKGYIYIGKDAEIMEGSCIRGSFAICEHAIVNMGSKIYGATTIGPHCKIGGELNNVIMFGYSNKGHDGFLGNAVIGEWCNLGAGTNASNLKNDYSEIKLWNYGARRFLRTGLQFCGLFMGDHSKSGINAMFNTATVVGVGVNVFGAGFPRNFVPSFSEGGNAGLSDVQLSKFFAIAEKMMARRKVVLTEIDREMFKAIYSQAENYK